MHKLLFAGNDKIGRRLVSKITDKDLDIALDNSFAIKRVYKLIKRKSLSISNVAGMAWADLPRKNPTIGRNIKKIRNREELLQEIETKGITHVFLFRVGMIINKTLLNSGAQFFNFHCAKLPEYGGTGAIHRALKNRDLNQEATFHEVTLGIDEGKVLKTMPYQMDLERTYRENEDIAYNAGISLFREVIDSF